MKRNFILIAFVMFALISRAQKEANIWYFGRYAGLDFNASPPTPLLNSQMDTDEGCASISDKNTGQLLFYSDGISVWNRNHALMPNGSNLNGHYSSTQSAVVVPMPGNSNRYYLFTADALAGDRQPNGIGGFTANGFGGISYSIVDMTLDAGRGDIVASTKNTPLLTPASEKICATRHCNGRDIWVVVHKWNSNEFYSYLVTPSGIAPPVISAIGAPHSDVGTGNNGESIGYMKFSADGSKLAVVITYMELMELFDFNVSTGVVSNMIRVQNLLGRPYGVSFSPDNTKLYVTSRSISSTTRRVFQYNMQAGSNAAIISSKTEIHSSTTFEINALQNGPDGRLYVAKKIRGPFPNIGSPTIDVIQNPNALGSACNYIPDAINLGGSTHTSIFGLPDFIENFLSQPVSATLTFSTACGGNQQLTFTDSLISGTINYNWDFGDPASGSQNFSALQNPTHTFSSSGNFTVRLIMSNNCLSDTFSRVVTVTGTSFQVQAGPDTTVCGIQPVVLTVTGATSNAQYSWAPTSGLSCSNCANPTASPTVSTTYRVTITDANGCSSTDSVRINISSSITAFVSSDTAVCIGNSVTLFAGGGRDYQWTPTSGLSDASISNPVATPSLTTTYTVLVADGSSSCSPDTASVTVLVIPTPVINPIPDTSICAGGAIVLQASGNNIATYSWSPSNELSCSDCSSPVFSPSTTTTFIFTANADSLCSRSDTFQIAVIIPNSAAASPDTIICAGRQVQLFASGGNQYQWFPPSNLNNPNIANPIANPTQTTTYSVIVSTPGCPADSATVTIVVMPLPFVEAGPDVSIAYGESVNLGATGTGTNYNWSPTSTLNASNISNPVASPLTTTTYTVLVTDNYGCTAQDDVTIFVEQEPANIFFPNAFTPNGDGVNDFFKGFGNNIKQYYLSVYNRWGEKVFETYNLQAGWDGTYKNEQQPVGVYVYYAEITWMNNVSEKYKGSLTLLK